MKTLRLTESIDLVKKHGVKFAEQDEATTEKDLEKAIEKTGFPIAMKLVSSTITHKTDVGGVKINIKTISEAKKEFSKMKKLGGFEKVIVQKMVRGTEIIIGGKRDVQFGPTVLVGLGGIYVEIFKDFSIGICPLSKRNAKEMIKELKAYPLLKGIRGKKGINISALEDEVVKVSKLMMKEKNIIELDLNPLIATDKEILAVDARIITD